MPGGKIVQRGWRTFSGVFTSLRSRNYRIYFIGQGVSLIGTWMQNLALSWLVYRLTGSVFLLGLTGFTSQIPTFFLTPITGVVTDRYNRLSIMKITQLLFMIQAMAMALLVMFNLIDVWHIIALSIVFGIITAFDAPARQSLVIELIAKPEELGNAIALNSAIFNGARLIGPAVAGVLIAVVGEGICFMLNAISFAAVLVALYLIKIPARKPSTRSSNFRESFTEGFHYTFRSMPIRTLIAILAILSIAGLSYIVLLPAYARENMHGSSDTLGYLMSAMGAGALTAALYMASRRSVLGLAKIITAAVIVLGVSITLASFSGNLYFSMVILFFGGVAMILSLSAINTMLQTIADEDKRGRVMSFYAMALMGTGPIGNLISGSVASAIGLTWTLALYGVLTIIAGVWFGIVRRSMRRFVRPIYITKGILTGLPDDIS